MIKTKKPLYLKTMKTLENERGSTNKRTLWKFTLFVIVLLITIILIWFTPEGTKFVLRRFISTTLKAFGL